MKLIIDIPDDDYMALEHCYRLKNLSDTLEQRIFSAVANGAVLPEGHGRLIDTNALIMGLDEYNEYATFDCDAVKDLIDTAPAVIEADPGGNKCES